MTDGDSAKLARQTTVAAAALVVGVALVAVAVWARRPRLEPIEVSQQTTYIITPTRADGWVDYPEAVDWMRRASLDAGGANAAVTLVRALGTRRPAERRRSGRAARPAGHRCRGRGRVGDAGVQGRQAHVGTAPPGTVARRD